MRAPAQTAASTTITYTYDELNRLTQASYDNGDVYSYTYDAVGNRLTETTPSGTTTSLYDIANRVTSVDGQTTTWDANGNLLSDGTNTYVYNSANRMTSLTQGANAYTYVYNGMGDRLQQTVDGVTTTYTNDLNAGLTQVLTDGTDTYLYGLTRLGEDNGVDWAYYHTDALGSIRQLSDAAGTVTLMQSYDPYGNVTSTQGLAESNYDFAGEWRDETGLQHLRARYYAPSTGRFTSRDTWGGDHSRPLSLNKWAYTEGNPVNYTDPSGRYPKAFTITAQSGYSWSSSDRQAVTSGVLDVAYALRDFLFEDMGYRMNNMTALGLFEKFFGTVNFYYNNGRTTGHYCNRWAGDTQIAPGVMCFNNSRNRITPRLIAHELGHVYNATIHNKMATFQEPIEKPYDQLYREGIFYTDKYGEEQHRLAGNDGNGYYRDNTGLSFQENKTISSGEHFADIFANWVVMKNGGEGLKYNRAGYAQRVWLEDRLRLDLANVLGLPPNNQPKNYGFIDDC